MVEAERYVDKDSMKGAAKEALRERLFVPRGWELNRQLHRIIEPPKKRDVEIRRRIVLGRVDGKAVGVLVATFWVDGVSVQIFVKKAYRRLGVGTKMLEALGEKGKLFYGEGSDASVKFWAKVLSSDGKFGSSERMVAGDMRLF